MFGLPLWLPTFGDLHSEWWAIARLPEEDIDELKDLVASRGPRRGPFAAAPGPGSMGRPGSAAGDEQTEKSEKPPVRGEVRCEADYGLGRFDPKDLEDCMPSLGNPVVDAATRLK